MRRRVQPSAPGPPARLLAFVAADWLPLVDDADYNLADWRSVRDCEPVGEPYLSLENWRLVAAEELYYEARRAWDDSHPADASLTAGTTSEERTS